MASGDALLSRYGDMYGDFDRARAAVAKYVESQLADYSIVFDRLGIDAIVDTCDIRGILRQNSNSFSSDDEPSHFGGGPGSSGVDTDAIDDLFDRDR